MRRSSPSNRPNDNRDALRLSGLDQIAIFVGKASALVIELLVLEVVLGLWLPCSTADRPFEGLSF